MCILGTWLSIDLHGENDIFLGFIHDTLYSKTKKAFPIRQNPAKNGFNKHATYLLLYFKILSN